MTDSFEAFFELLLSPVTITCIIIVLGYYLGKIKICGISLDLSAVLIVAVLFGALMSSQDFLNGITADIIDLSFRDFKLLSSLGSSIFIASIGFAAAYTFLRIDATSALKHILFGIAMVTVSLMLLTSFLIGKTSFEAYTILGVFCGAMTSTPALTVICDSGHTAQAITGYSSSYIFGVVGVVLFVQLFNRTDSNAGKSIIPQKDSTSHESLELYGIIPIMTAIAIGSILNSLLTLLLKMSIGNSACTLIVSFIAGIFMLKNSVTIPDSTLKIFRNFGLMLFLVGTGIPAGEQFINSFNFKYVLYGAVFTSFSVTVTFISAKRFLKSNTPDSLYSVCGVMTSTPAVGVLLKSNRSVAQESIYSLSYIGALAALMIGMSIVSKYVA